MGLLLGLVAIGANAESFTPFQGHYWNPAESGTGYNVSVQNGTMVTAIYSYNTSGSPLWYLVICNLSEDLKCDGTLDKYKNGQSIAGSYVEPSSDGNDGLAKFTWLSETKIKLELPQNRTTTLTPFNFKIPTGPGQLLGKWVFVAMATNGEAVSTDVINFTKIVGDKIIAPDNATACTLIDNIFKCITIDTAGFATALWNVSVTADQARGVSGNVLDNNAVVQGYRLNPAVNYLE